MRAGEPGGQQEQSQDELGPCCERGHGAPCLSVLGDRKKLNEPLALPSMHQVRDKALKHPSCPFHSSDVLKAARQTTTKLPWGCNCQGTSPLPQEG